MAKHILVTNDDGVFAPGLLSLAQEMSKFGKVSILAPDRNWSGGGHVKTLDRALRVKEVRLADGMQAVSEFLIYSGIVQGLMQVQISVTMSPIPGP